MLEVEDNLSKSHHAMDDKPQTQVVRTSLNSCMTCRTRKKKCDRILPKCTSCLMRGAECSYNSQRRRCFGCTEAKRRCSKELPKCKRCVSRGVECKYPSLYGETKAKAVQSGYSGTKKVLAVQSLKRKQERLNPNERYFPSQSPSLNQHQNSKLIETNHVLELSSSCKDYLNGDEYVTDCTKQFHQQDAGLGIPGPHTKNNLDDKSGGNVLPFKIPPSTFPLYKAQPNSVFQTDCSIEKANEYYGKLTSKPNESDWTFCSQMEENQYQFQPQKIVTTAIPKKALSAQSLKMKQELLDSHVTECSPIYLSPFEQTQTRSIMEMTKPGLELTSSCKDYIKNQEQVRPVHRQDIGRLTDSHFQKSSGDKCSDKVLSSVIKTPNCCYPLYKAPLNPAFQTDNCKQQQVAKKHCRSQEFSMENSSDLSLGEGASSVQEDSSAEMNVKETVILPPESPLPSYTRLPAENNMIGSKSNLFLAAFIRRYTSWHSFLVDLNGIQKAMDRAFFSGPQGIKSLYEVPADRCITLHEMNDRARHAGILAAVGLGSVQLWYLDQEMHQSCYNLIWQLLECCAEQVTEEVIFAHAVAALYCKLTNNTTGLLRHIQFFNKLVQRCGTQLQGRIQSFHSYYSLWASLESTEMKQLECDKSIWQLIAKETIFCNFEEDFPLMHNAMLQAPSNISTQQQQIWINHLRHVPSQNLQVLTLPTVSWVRRLLINEYASDNFKTKALQEVLNFVGSASRFYHGKSQFPPALKCYLLSTQSFLLLLAGRCSEAKKVLDKQVEMYIHDPLLCACMLSSNLVHQVHFLCMALSTLEMYESYQMFQQKVNAMTNILRIPHLPIEPPISNHGLCDEPECMLIWNRLTIPDVPKFGKEVLNPGVWEF